MKFTFAVVLLIIISQTYGLNLLKLTKIALEKHARSVLRKSNGSQCIDDLNRLLDDVDDMKLWSLRMIDSAGKINAGYLEGNFQHLGSYGECMKVDSGDGIKGKFCMATLVPMWNTKEYFTKNAKLLEIMGLNHPLKLNLTEVGEYLENFWGLCVPRSCAASELNKIARDAASFNTKVQVQFYDKQCMTNDSKPLDTEGIVITSLIILACILIVASTLYDKYYHHKYEGRYNDLLIMFSLKSNGEKLFSRREESNLSAIVGMRLLSMMLVIFSHLMMVNCIVPNINAFSVLRWVESYKSLPLATALLSVETFFCMSGMLLVYLYLDTTATQGVEVPIYKLYMHRMFRLYPGLIVIIAIYVVLVEYFGDGPHWFLLEKFHLGACKSYWWSSMLFIQNYYNPIDVCVIQTWFLAVDTQLYFLSPLILRPMLKHPKYTLTGILLACFLSMAASFAVTYQHDLGSVPNEFSKKYFTNFYMPTHIRMSTWLIGTVWGYFLYKSVSEKTKLNKVFVMVMWKICFNVMISISLLYVNFAQNNYGVFERALFNTLVRPLWAMCIGWILFACIKGYGGPINWILSLNIYTVLSRLSYSMFLVHLMIIATVKAQVEEASYFSPAFTCLEFISMFIMTTALALVWTLGIEFPAVAFEKWILREFIDKPKENNYNNNLLNSLQVININVDVNKNA